VNPFAQRNLAMSAILQAARECSGIVSRKAWRAREGQ